MIELKRAYKIDVKILTEIDPNLGWAGIEYELIRD